jgi:hypothetical protein
MSDKDDGRDSKIELISDAVYKRSATARKEWEPAWPGIADPYRAAATPENDALPRLVVVMGSDRFKPGNLPAYYTLPYHDMGIAECGFGDGFQWFRIPFHESGRARLLEARGRSILRIFDYISLSRMPWIRLADRDFRGADTDTPIFTHISVEELLAGE